MLGPLPIHYAIAMSLVWLGGCVVVYYALPRTGFTVYQSPTVLLALAVVTALVVRLIPAVVLPRGALYDIESFQRVAETFLNGEGVYSSPVVSGRHPYFPFHIYIIGMAMWLSKVIGLPFVFTVKWTPMLADVGLVALIFQSLRRLGRSTGQAIAWSLLYALNPVSILVSAYHGQFDAEPAFLLALSWYLWRFGSTLKRRIVLSALALGFAVLTKTWPALFLPIMFIRFRATGQRLVYSLITLAVPSIFTLLYIFVFHEDPQPLLRRALTHAGVPGWWGPSAVVNILRGMTGWGEPVLNWLARYSRWFVFAGLGLTYWLTRKQSSIEALTTALLGLYVSSSGFGLQWVLWVVPFALLTGDVRGLDRYVLGALIYLLPSYYGHHLDMTLRELFPFEWMALVMQVCAIPAWVITLVWGIRRSIAARLGSALEAQCYAQRPSG